MNHPDILHPGFARLPRLRPPAARLRPLRRLIEASRGERLITLATRFAWLIGHALGVASLLWAGVIVSRADTHYVTTNGPGPSPYLSWAEASSNIQDAINVAEAATFDTVLVSNGTYNLTNQISIEKNITVRSLYGTNDVNKWSIINGHYPDYTNRCVYINNVAGAILDGFIISNGYATGIVNYCGGGGVYIKTAGSVNNCYIRNNYAFSANSNSYSGGGGIYLNGGGTVSNCSIFSNTADIVTRQIGGGIYHGGGNCIASRISGNLAYQGGGMTAGSGLCLSNCTIDGNTAINAGGGIYDAYGTVANCVISNNICNGEGGGLYIMYGAQVLSSIIIGNSANKDGGISVTRASIISNCQVIANIATNATAGVGGINCSCVYPSGSFVESVVSDCTIAYNRGIGSGAGLYVYSTGTHSNLVRNCLIYGNTNLGANGGGVYLNRTGHYPRGLINCTIANNEAGTLGGGICATTYSNYIANCVIYGNVTTNDTHDEVYNTDAGGTNNFWYNCAPTNLVAGQGNTTNNPLFINAGNRNYRLGNGSPCINTGTNMSWMTNSFDLDGRARVRYGIVDMGAYEAIYSGTMYGFR